MLFKKIHDVKVKKSKKNKLLIKVNEMGMSLIANGYAAYHYLK